MLAAFGLLFKDCVRLYRAVNEGVMKLLGENLSVLSPSTHASTHPRIHTPPHPPTHPPTHKPTNPNTITLTHRTHRRVLLSAGQGCQDSAGDVQGLCGPHGELRRLLRERQAPAGEPRERRAGAEDGGTLYTPRKSTPRHATPRHAKPIRHTTATPRHVTLRQREGVLFSPAVDRLCVVLVVCWQSGTWVLVVTVCRPGRLALCPLPIL